MPGHAELAWLLGCLTPLGWLNRMTQFKEKAGKKRDEAGLGLYAYPVLMAADILLYKATHVPVGEDQKQHLELVARHRRRLQPPLRRRVLSPARAADLRRGDPRHEPARRLQEMSKSDSSDYSRINMTDDADTVALKIRRAKTDPHPLPDSPAAADARPEADNLLGIYAALADLSREDAIARHAGRNFSDFKRELSDLAVEVLGKIGGEMRRLLDDPGYIDGVLSHGAVRANAVAAPVLREAFDLMGLLRP